MIPLVADHGIIVKGQGRIPEALHEEVVDEPLKIAFASFYIQALNFGHF